MAGDIAVYLCRDPVDFRAGINGLSVLVEQTLKYDPFSRNLFGFVNKRRNQIKVLYWQRSGFCLWAGSGWRIFMLSRPRAIAFAAFAHHIGPILGEGIINTMDMNDGQQNQGA